MTKSVPAALVLIGLALVVLLMWMYHRPSTGLDEIAAGTEQARVSESLSGEFLNSGDSDTDPQRSADPGRNARSNGLTEDASASGDFVPLSRQPAGQDELLEPDWVDEEQDEENVIGGMVIDEEGEPLSGIEVLALHVDPEKGPSSNFDQMDAGVLSVYSDSEGAFLFRNLEDGTYQLRIAPADGVAPNLTTVRVGPLNVKLVVAFQWEIRVHGTVSSAAGKPLENVQVTAGRQSPAARTGSRGEYEFDVSLQGYNRTKMVHYRLEDYRDQKMLIDPSKLDYRAAELQLDVTMERNAGQTTVTGSLLDTQGREVPGRTMTMASSRLRTSYKAKSDDRGKFAFRKVEPGNDYRLQVRAGSGYKDKNIDSLEVPDSGLKMDVVLERTENGELSGWMVDLEGNPVPGFPLKLHSRVVAGKSVRVVGDPQGFFLVQDFPVGEAMLSTNSYPVFSVQGIRVSAPPEEPITAILDRGPHVLEGRVVDSLGDPVAADSILLGWTFNLGEVKSKSSRKTAADRNGYFVFTDLGPGVHRMWVSAPGFRTVVVDVDIGVERDEFVVKLEPAP